MLKTEAKGVWNRKKVTPHKRIFFSNSKSNHSESSQAISIQFKNLVGSALRPVTRIDESFMQEVY